MNEREIKSIGIIVGVGLVGMAILNSAYRAGFSDGLAQGGQGTAVVPEHGGFGFFPFPPLLLIIVGVVLFVGWRRRWAGDSRGPSGHGPGGGRPPRLFDEWHRRAHEAGDDGESAATQGAAGSPRHTGDSRIV